MSLNIKDAYDKVIDDYLESNAYFPPHFDRYASLPLFKKVLDEYAKEKLEAFIDDHFPEEVSRETTTATSSDYKITINYEGNELSAEEKLIAKITKKLSEDLNKQRDEQIEFFKRLLRD